MIRIIRSSKQRPAEVLHVCGGAGGLAGHGHPLHVQWPHGREYAVGGVLYSPELAADPEVEQVEALLGDHLAVWLREVDVIEAPGGRGVEQVPLHLLAVAVRCVCRQKKERELVIRRYGRQRMNMYVDR